MTDLVLTEEQTEIIEFIRRGQGHLLIDAGAGCAKTSTLLESLKYVPQKSALMCAFNKKIADELNERMGKAPPGSMWKAATFHSCGLRILQSHRPRLDIRPEASEDLVNDAVTQYEADALTSNASFSRVSFQARRTAVKLLRLLKETRTDRELKLIVARQVGEANDVFKQIADDDRKLCCEIAVIAYELGLDLKSRNTIDFCDMTWLPVVLDLKPPNRYQVVFVDEAQDLSLLQLQLVKKLVAPNGRLIAVGDLDQAIYAWRGAAGNAIWREMLEVYKAVKLPLTTTFRCSRLVVKEANQFAQGLRPRENAPDGSVLTCSFEELPKLLKDRWSTETFVLSRNNSDLLHTALFLWRANVGFKLIAGKEIVDPLFDIIDKLYKKCNGLITPDRFRQALRDWHTEEMTKAEQSHASAWADRIEQQYESLVMMLGYSEPKAFKNLLQGLINAGGMSAITLSTVHKVKGLEAERVFLLKQTFSRHRYLMELAEAQDDWQIDRARDRLADIDQEELNLEYVAVTRAKLDLIWVDMRGGSTAALARLFNAQGKSA